MTHTVSQAFRPYNRIGNLILAVCAFLGTAGSPGAKANEVENELVIRVVLYNYADVARLELRAAEHQTAALMAQANVRVVWREYSRRVLSAPSGTHNLAQEFCVRILRASTIKRSKRIFGPEVLGFSITPGGKAPVPGQLASVFYDRVKQVSTLSGLYPGKVLGEAIAHELGHLLGARHSFQGIMKAHWTSRDLQQIRNCKLRFSATQVALIQRAALILKGNSSPGAHRPALTPAS